MGQIRDKKLLLVNAYFPTQDKPSQQLDLINVLETLLKNNSDYHYIVGGDLNIILDPQLDKYGIKTKKYV